MVRTPYYDKSGLKKGPWTPEEDQILISYIQQHGYSNWRALPKQAGLLRCGKSCRLRWLNYLRPDIKRGNFSKEEEGFIMKLHEMMGNKWSAIAAKLPGRTDNEIKNVWHTYLKKRLKNHQTLVPNSDSSAFCGYQQEVLNFACEDGVHLSPSPQNSSSEIPSFSNLSSLPNNMEMKDEQILNSTFPEIGKSCWSSELAYNSHAQPVFFGVGDNFHLRSLTNDYNINKDDCMNFWYNLLNGTSGLSDF